MINHPDRAPLMRLAATLPVGSSERRTILATIKKLAGTMDDTLARADLDDQRARANHAAVRPAGQPAPKQRSHPFLLPPASDVSPARDRLAGQSTSSLSPRRYE